MTFHINQPSSFTWAWTRRCRRCKTLTNHVVTSYIWYGPTTTCCQCGAYVNDGVLRRKRKGDTKGAAWATAVWPTLPRRTEYTRWITAAVNGSEADQ